MKIRHPYPYYIKKLPEDKKRSKVNLKYVAIAFIVFITSLVVFLKPDKEVKAVREQDEGKSLLVDVDNISLDNVLSGNEREKGMHYVSKKEIRRKKIHKVNKKVSKKDVSNYEKKDSKSKEVVKHIKKEVVKRGNLSKAKGISFSMPIKGILVRDYGYTKDEDLGVFMQHNGVDIGVSSYDKFVRSVRGGEVIFAGKLAGFRKAVIIKSGKYKFVYANLLEVYVNEGDEVEKGDIVGKVARDSKGRYILHFEVRRYNKPIPPYRFLR